jgi:hypothetical protein
MPSFGSFPSHGSSSLHSPRPTCQVCGKLSHIALNCYRRFDRAFSGPHLIAYTAGPSQPRDHNWYPNTGATHCITSDLKNLNLHSEAYGGLDEIQVGDGTRFAIKNTGISKLSPNFILRFILHVPQITKNLLSIQKFTSDNNVYVEFHPSCFFVKDPTLGKILHRGLSRHGLYHWFTPATAPPSIFSTSRTSFVDWHARLGHPVDRIVRHVLSKFQLPYVPNKKLIVCPDCQHGKSHQLPFLPSEHKSSAPLDLIFSDIWGPSPILSNNGARFYIILLITLVNLLGFIQLLANLTFSLFFPSFRLMSKANLIAKSNLSKPMVVANSSN